MELINVYTGEAADQETMHEACTRAKQICCNPYATPEQLKWAAMVDPEGFVENYLFADRPKKNVTVACGTDM